MSIQLDIISPDGNDLVLESALNIAARTRYGVEKALWDSGRDIQKEFSRQVLARNKTGRLYTRTIAGGRKRSHRASAPGETAANVTGEYRKSFDSVVNGAHQLTVGLSRYYAGWLELGTSRLKARPGLRNTLVATERDIIRNLAGGIEDSL